MQNVTLKQYWKALGKNEKIEYAGKCGVNHFVMQRILRGDRDLKMEELYSFHMCSDGAVSLELTMPEINWAYVVETWAYEYDLWRSANAVA